VYQDQSVARAVDKPGKSGQLFGAVSESKASIGEPSRVAR
jgi:hypothetical protein